MTSTSVPAYTEHPSIPYPCASDPTRQALDLYLPPSSSSSSPLLVYIHGSSSYTLFGYQSSLSARRWRLAIRYAVQGFSAEHR